MAEKKRKEKKKEEEKDGDKATVVGLLPPDRSFRRKKLIWVEAR